MLVHSRDPGEAWLRARELHFPPALSVKTNYLSKYFMLMTKQFRIEHMILYLWITLTTIRDISGSQTFWIVAPRKEACDFLL